MRALRASVCFVGAAVAVACGARTALLGGAAPGDAGSDASDAATRDAARDAPIADVLPPIDAVKPDVILPPPACADSGATLIYLVTEQNQLLSFYPPALAFKTIGPIACPTMTASPYSMGVDREGIAYSVFDDGELFRIDTASAACTATSYVPGQLGWTTFGMGYAGTPDGGESLYVTEANFNMPSMGLGVVDPEAGVLSIVGPFSTPLPRCELTGTGDGRLFAFCLNQSGSGSDLAQIDPATARVVAQDPLTVGNSSEGFAFAFWGGDFWIFTGTTQSTTVTMYDPVAKSLTTETTLAGTIVGAGVSTCAPQ